MAKRARQHTGSKSWAWGFRRLSSDTARSEMTGCAKKVVIGSSVARFRCFWRWNLSWRMSIEDAPILNKSSSTLMSSVVKILK